MTGIIIIDKPAGATSFDVVARARRLCGEKKCGHAGTLDPMATGVLIVALGGATRFIGLAPNGDKTYEAAFRLGTVSDTLDITGKISETREVASTAEEVKKALAEFVGETEQIPPMYSAVKVNGKRLYSLARRGIEVERKPRRINIYKLETLGENEKAGEYAIKIECSAGTYIRALISDLGEKLGCGAVMTALRRTAANGFKIEDAVSLERLSEAAKAGETEKFLIPVERVLEAYPAVKTTGAQAKRFKNGGELSLERLACERVSGFYRVFGPNGDFIGVGEIGDGGALKPKRVFNDRGAADARNADV